MFVMNYCREVRPSRIFPFERKRRVLFKSFHSLTATLMVWYVTVWGLIAAWALSFRKQLELCNMSFARNIFCIFYIQTWTLFPPYHWGEMKSVLSKLVHVKWLFILLTKVMYGHTFCLSGVKWGVGQIMMGVIIGGVGRLYGLYWRVSKEGWH